LSKWIPNLVVISAPSGAGKTTVLARVLQETPGIRFSVSHTTRPPRPGEKEGLQYHFVDEAGFSELVRKDLLLEHADVHGHRYGTCRTEYELAEKERVDLLLDLDVQGFTQVRGKFRQLVSVFILPPSYQHLEARLRGRGQDEEASIERRLAVAWGEVRLYKEYDYAIVNDNVDDCVENLKGIIRAARCRVDGRIDQRAKHILETFGSK